MKTAGAVWSASRKDLERRGASPQCSPERVSELEALTRADIRWSVRWKHGGAPGGTCRLGSSDTPSDFCCEHSAPPLKGPPRAKPGGLAKNCAQPLRGLNAFVSR